MAFHHTALALEMAANCEGLLTYLIKKIKPTTLRIMAFI